MNIQSIYKKWRHSWCQAICFLPTLLCSNFLMLVIPHETYLVFVLSAFSLLHCGFNFLFHFKVILYAVEFDLGLTCDSSAPVTSKIHSTRISRSLGHQDSAQRPSSDEHSINLQEVAALSVPSHMPSSDATLTK